MIRLFVAVDLDPVSRGLLSGLGRTIPGARVVPEEQLHLTLRFIGEVEGTLFLDIREQLASVEASGFTLSVKGVGHFPPRGKPRVLWAGVEPAGELIILRNKINRALSRCGVAPEKRTFHPHVTLARLNNSPTGRVMRFLAGNSFLLTPPFTVREFILYSSVLTSKGASHAVEASYPLGPP